MIRPLRLIGLGHDPFLDKLVKNVVKDNTIKGKITELKCQEDFIQRGYLISQPIVADSKYDFIADINNTLYRIQCKSANLSLEQDYISFKAKTTNIRTMKDSYYTKDDIDYFYTYYDNISYLIPVEQASHGENKLRFSAKVNNGNIKWAKDYELDTM